MKETEPKKTQEDIKLQKDIRKAEQYMSQLKEGCTNENATWEVHVTYYKEVLVEKDKGHEIVRYQVPEDFKIDKKSSA